MSVVLLKNLNYDNSVIGFYTSLLYIPWTIKFAWAPLVDLLFTRRRWILVSHLVLSILLFLLSGTILTQVGLNTYLAVFALIAFTSATQDIAIDGFYMDVLNKEEQAFWVGIRNTAYRTAWLFGSGAMVSLAGFYMEQAKNSPKAVAEAWALAFVICAVIFVVATAWHLFFLPKLPRAEDSLVTQRVQGVSENSNSPNRIQRFVDAFLSFADQPRFAVIVLYILTFRVGDAFLLKMAQPFLLDPPDKGGLGISTAQVGLIYGTVGVGALLIGGIVGGLLVAKYGLKRCLLPTAIFQNGAILLYWLMAIFKPGVIVVAALNALEQFVYGLGFTAYTVFLLSVVKSEYRAAHYAIATALMAISLVGPGAISGYLTNWLGYQNFFLFSFFSSIPGIICIFYLPLRQMPDPSLPVAEKT